LVLALVNMFLKPLLVLLSIPALLLSLGLFMLVVNGATIWIASRLYDQLFVASFGWAIVAGIIVGLVNYLVTRVLEDL
jgi:putative membrane protein